MFDVVKNGKWGIIDRFGNIIVDPQFENQSPIGGMYEDLIVASTTV